MHIGQELVKYINKDIHFVMEPGAGASSGKLISVQYNTDFTFGCFIVDTRWSCKQCFNLTKLQSFWADEDKPTE
jgi:hypothetical protein